MPALLSGRVACRSTGWHRLAYYYKRFSAVRIVHLRTAGRGKFEFDVHVDDTGFSTANGEWDRNIDSRRLHRSTGWRRVARHAETAAYELPPPAATV
jgi:hypothetical protein